MRIWSKGTGASEGGTTTVPTDDERYEQTFAIRSDPKQRYLLHNRTPRRICIIDEGGRELVVPPLAERVVSGARLAPFAADLKPLRQRHQLRVREYSRPPRRARPAILAIWLALAVLVVIAVHDILKEGTLERREVLVSAFVAALLIAVVLGRAAWVERNRRAREEIADTDEGDIEFGVGGAFYDGNDTVRGTKHVATLLLVLTVGAVLPAIAIFVATDAKDFLVMDGGLDVVDGKESRLVGRVIQVMYTAVLSLFPAILYYQFDRHRVGTIRSQWVRAIFRMDKRMETLADVNARYGDELSDASSYSTDSVRFLGGHHSPIVVATLLITLGWTLLVVRTDSFDFAGASEVGALVDTASDAAARANGALEEARSGDTDTIVAAGAANVAQAQAAEAGDAAESVAEASTGDDSATPSAITTPAAAGSAQDAITRAAAAAAAAQQRAADAAVRIDRPYFQFLVPTPSAATMAFLGAYFFGLYALLRSYFRGDLRPKIYNQITARLVTVVVLAYLINALFYDSTGRNEYVWVLSFVAGVVPTAVLQQLGQAAAAVLVGHKGRDAADRTGAVAGEPPAPARKPRNGRRAAIRQAIEEAFATPRALTQLDGLDIHDSIRLEAEGINDIPALARSDLVSVMVSTRVPIDRLIDWQDQAVLILLLDDDADEELDKRVVRLRRIGIRSASAIVAVDECPCDPRLRAAVEKILRSPVGSADTTTLCSLANEIRREPAMRRILQWYNSEYGVVDKACPSIIVRSRGALATTRADPRPPSTPAPSNGDGDGHPAHV